MIKKAPLKDAINVEIRELMLEWVKDQKVVDPAKVFEANWRVVPAGVLAADGVHYK